MKLNTVSLKQYIELRDAIVPIVEATRCSSFAGLVDSCPVSIIVEPHIVWLENVITVGDIRRLQRVYMNQPKERGT